MREVKEELGIIIDAEDARFVHTMHRPKRDETGERVDLFFEVTQWSGDVENMEPEKCDDVKWFPIRDLPHLTIPYVKAALNFIEQKILYSELGHDYF